MIKLAGHSVDETLVPEAPYVLDVGCRGFDFTREVLARWPKAIILALDPDPLIKDLNIRGVVFSRKALVHDGRPTSNYVSFGDGTGNYLTDQMSGGNVISVPCVNIRDVGTWDVIKLDCEGSEFGLLENWPGPIARQISVEFHDWCDRTKDDAYFNRLFAKLPWYEVVQHELTPVGPANSMGHWDSVLVLKPEFR